MNVTLEDMAPVVLVSRRHVDLFRVCSAGC